VPNLQEACIARPDPHLIREQRAPCSRSPIESAALRGPIELTRRRASTGAPRPATRSRPAIARKPRVAVDLRAAVAAPTGIGVYTLALLRELARVGELDLLALAHREPLAAPELRRDGIAVEWQPAPLGVVWQQTLLPRRLAKGDVDLFWSPLLTLPRARLAVPAVVTLHDLTVIHHPETLPLKVRWSLLPFLERSMDQAARIVVGSEATARDAERAFPAARAKLRVVQHGVDAEFVPADAATIRAERERLGAPDGYFLFVGSLEPRKNVGLLLDAWELLRRDQPDSGAKAALPLLLAGPEGWKNRSLRGRLEALATSGVRHLGRLDRHELARVVAAASTLVFPSLYEGFGLPVAEAMACGVPVVVSNRASLPEIAGDGGLVVDADDAGALAEAMARLATDRTLAAELGGRALERSRRFTWQRAAAELTAVFREALGAA
jgi:glycosyltransferase involved in cell wall biosynthesis